VYNVTATAIQVLSIGAYVHDHNLDPNPGKASWCMQQQFNTITQRGLGRFLGVSVQIDRLGHVMNNPGAKILHTFYLQAFIIEVSNLAKK